MDKVLSVIVATTVLHNIARRAGDPLPPDDPVLPALWEDVLENGHIPCRNDRLGNNDVQYVLINEYF